MSIPNVIFTFIFTLVLSSPSVAVVIGDKDWNFLSGVSDTSYDQMDVSFDTSSGSCNRANCVVNGFDFTGYSWASNAEVNELLISLVGGTGFASLTLDGDTSSQSLNYSGFFTSALVSDTSGPGYNLYNAYTRDRVSQFEVGVIYVSHSEDITFTDNARIATRENRSDPRGVWTYRAVAVPEPSVAALMGLGLLGFCATRRKQMKN